MTRFTVTYSSNALDELAELWLASANRRALTAAADAIEIELRHDA